VLSNLFTLISDPVHRDVRSSRTLLLSRFLDPI
jgi:hypothetical protein